MNTPSHSNVTILCSGFGLGMYIPGLLLRQKFEKLSIPASIEVFESLLPIEALENIEKNRRECQTNFKFALAAQKIPGDMRDRWNPMAVQELLEMWRQDTRQHFIVLSGHWVHVLTLYQSKYPELSIHVDLLYLDADLPTSWRQLRKLCPNFERLGRVVRLLESSNSELELSLDFNQGPPIPFRDRVGSLVAHGGGWGVGTYQDCLDALDVAGYRLSVMCYQVGISNHREEKHRYYIDDPAWRSWHRDEHGDYHFPGFGQITPKSAPIFQPRYRSHGLHEIIRQASAIVSKPGGGTLLESFATATPVVMLTPFGAHEAANAKLWEVLGFGIPLDTWAAAGYPQTALERLHKNLMNRRKHTIDYAEDYVQRILSGEQSSKTAFASVSMS